LEAEGKVAKDKDGISARDERRTKLPESPYEIEALVEPVFKVVALLTVAPNQLAAPT
jgi:hypothetical protein